MKRTQTRYGKEIQHKTIISTQNSNMSKMNQIRNKVEFRCYGRVSRSWSTMSAEVMQVPVECCCTWREGTQWKNQNNLFPKTLPSEWTTLYQNNNRCCIFWQWARIGNYFQIPALCFMQESWLWHFTHLECFSDAMNHQVWHLYLSVDVIHFRFGHRGLG